MKINIIVIFAFLFTSISLMGQGESKWKELDKSPMDKVYYPSETAWRNYLDGEDRNMRPKIKLVYSRPGKKGRDIFGTLVPYDKEWRLGANEANEITFYSTISLGGEKIPRGNYTLFAKSAADHWTIILSSQQSLWGSENRDESKTVAMFKVNTSPTKEVIENLSMTFQRVDDDNANMVIAWDKTMVSIPINFNPVLFEDMAVSPMDQVHYPAKSAYHNYLKGDEIKSADKKVKITYGRPQKKGRKIFGELLPYGKLWRVGANQSTEITFYEDVTIKGQAIKKGTYNVYAMVNEKSWDIILNKDMPAWGAANRNKEMDVAKINVAPTQGNEDLEILNIIFDNATDNSVDLVIAWEKTRVSIPIKFK